MIGKTISHYRILEKLGEGGMGVVYKAEDLKLRRTVAIKFLPEEHSGSGEARDRFLAEARAASILNHPNICTIHEIDEVDGSMFIVMELIEGESLRKTIEGGPLPFKQVIGIGQHIAAGLNAAHAKGVVHRDIKPENIIVTAGGTAKIADFGIAGRGGGLHVSDGAEIAGTVAYMSPEQLRGENVDKLTDIWSLGVILYEMATGRLPFAGGYPQATMYSIINEAPQPAAEFRPDIPAPLRAVIERCLEKKPASRFQEASELRDEIRKSIDGAAAKPAGKAAPKCVAVLPFSDISPGQDHQYISDGLTEEIIANLSRLRDLQLISRASVMQYNRTGKTMRKIGEELCAQYLIDGSVRTSGADLRMTAQLVDTAEDVVLWADTYSGSIDEIFDFQENVAARIVKALKMRITPNERRNLKKRATKDTEAYQLYLKGRFFWGKRSLEGLRTAIRYFEEAIAKDERYALAWAGIADTYNLLSEVGGIARKEMFRKAMAAAERAVEIDPQLAEAHTSRALLLMLDELDWVKAGEEFQISLKLNPNYPTTYHWIAEWYLYQGKPAEAIAAIRKAAALDPLSAAIMKDTGLTFYYVRDYDAALEWAQKAMEIDPGLPSVQRLLSLAYQAKGMYAEAIEANNRWGKLSENRLESEIALAQIYAVAGRQAESRAILDQLNLPSVDSGNALRGIGLVYTSLGDADKAFEWFTKGFDAKAESLCSLKVDPKVDSLRSDPRFTDLLKKVRLA